MSKSNWLDRLHSSKGTSPSPEFTDLDQFLSSQKPNPKNPTCHNPKPPANSHPNQDSMFDLMTNVLSDLFIMDTNAIPEHARRASRKQETPKIFDTGKREVSPLSVNDGDVKKKKTVKGKSGMKDLMKLGFTRTEVTVIDTSLLPEWKGGRVLYRKGLVWKVREKKVIKVGRKRKRFGNGNEAGQMEKLGMGSKGRPQGGASETFVSGNPPGKSNPPAKYYSHCVRSIESHITKKIEGTEEGQFLQ